MLLFERADLRIADFASVVGLDAKSTEQRGSSIVFDALQRHLIADPNADFAATQFESHRLPVVGL